MSDLKTVNDLIEQNETRAEALSLEVDRAVECVNQVEQMMTELKSALGSADQEAQTRFEAFNTVLDTLEETLDGDLHTAKERLDSLQQKITDLDSQIDTVSDEAKTQLAEFKSHVESTLAEVESEVEAVQTGLDQFSQQIEAAETEAGTQGEALNGEIESFRNAANETQTSMGDRKTELVEQFDALEEELREKFESVLETLDSLMEGSGEKHSALEDILNTTSSEVTDTVTEKFTGEVQSQLTDSIELLSGAMSTLSDLSESSHELLDGALGDVVDGITEVLDAIEPVMDVLETVADMLG
jgi:DNA repair exonuclease SbcCD ATPase subunit